jgi:hypothetical protein
MAIKKSLWISKKDLLEQKDFTILEEIKGGRSINSYCCKENGMSEIREIDIYIKPDGTVKLEVRGVKGTKCLELTEELETGQL